MGRDAFRYEFTGKELKYFLFSKKVCPKCGGKMIKKKCSEIVEGANFNTASVPLYITGRDVDNYYYSFTCEKCGSQFTLKELSER